MRSELVPGLLTVVLVTIVSVVLVFMLGISKAYIIVPLFGGLWLLAMLAREPGPRLRPPAGLG